MQLVIEHQSFEFLYRSSDVLEALAMRHEGQDYALRVPDHFQVLEGPPVEGDVLELLFASEPA